MPASDAPGALIRLAAWISVAAVGLLFIMVALAALPALDPGANPFTWEWQPYDGKFGILPMLAGSLVMALLAILLGWPLSLGLACWLLTAEAHPRLKKMTLGLVRFMATIPTVVYGFAAVFLLTPAVRQYLGGTGMCVASAAIMLSLLTTPTMTLVLLAGLGPRMHRLALPGLALGFSRLDIFSIFAIPAGASNLVAAGVLGFGRAVGDTLLPLMLAGNAAVIPGALSESARTLTAHMALVTANEVGAAAFNSLFIAGLILLLTNAGVSLGLRRLVPRGVQEGAGYYTGSPHIGGFLLLARFMRVFCRFTVLATWLAVGALMVFLLWKGLPALDKALIFADTPPLLAISGKMPVWDGLWPALCGTAALVALTMVLALFPGIGCGIYLSEFAHGRIAARIRLAMYMLAGTPSIVMGLFGFTLILFLRRFIWPGANTSLILSAICVALLVLPVLVTTTAEALGALPASLRLTCAALGFNRRKAVAHILLPAAAPGISGGILLALGRAAEDTAVIMLTGVVANAGMPAGLGAKFEALPFSIFYTAAQYQTQEELARGFGAALILLAVSTLLAIMAAVVQRKMTGKFRS